MPETSLFKKVRLKPGQRAAIVNAPEGYLEELGPLAEGVEVVEKLEGESDGDALHEADLR